MCICEKWSNMVILPRLILVFMMFPRVKLVKKRPQLGLEEQWSHCYWDCLCPSWRRLAAPLSLSQIWAPFGQSGSRTPSRCRSRSPPPEGRKRKFKGNKSRCQCVSVCVFVLPGCFPSLRWTPFCWPHWLCYPRCHSEVYELQSLLPELLPCSDLRGIVIEIWTNNTDTQTHTHTHTQTNTHTHWPIRSMKLLKDCLLRLLRVTFMANAKSARSARCCQRSTRDWSSGCGTTGYIFNDGHHQQLIVLFVTSCICKVEAVEVSHLAVAVAIGVALRSESWCSHVGASYCLDLSDEAELVPVQQLLGKVGII